MKRLPVLLIAITILAVLLSSCSGGGERSETTTAPDLFYPIDVYLPLDAYSLTMSSVPGLPIELYSDYPFDIACEGAGSLIELTADGKILPLDTPIEDARDMTYYWLPDLSQIAFSNDAEPTEVSTITLYNPTQVIKIGVYLIDGTYSAKILDEPEI